MKLLLIFSLAVACVLANTNTPSPVVIQEQRRLELEKDSKPAYRAFEENIAGLVKVEQKFKKFPRGNFKANILQYRLMKFIEGEVYDYDYIAKIDFDNGDTFIGKFDAEFHPKDNSTNAGADEPLSVLKVNSDNSQIKRRRMLPYEIHIQEFKDTTVNFTQAGSDVDKNIDIYRRVLAAYLKEDPKYRGHYTLHGLGRPNDKNPLPGQIFRISKYDFKLFEAQIDEENVIQVDYTYELTLIDQNNQKYEAEFRFNHDPIGKKDNGIAHNWFKLSKKK
jgi:hypothetical protein